MPKPKPKAPLPVPRHRPSVDEDAPPFDLEAIAPGTARRDLCIDGIDASARDWSRSTFTRVELTESRLTGLDLSEAKLSDVAFVRCKLDYVNLRLAKLERVRFDGCVLVDGDFGTATLEHCVFDGCDLTTADFTHARLQHVDLRGSKLVGLKGANALGGATIESAQCVGLAFDLARELGITVDDESPKPPAPPE